MNTVDQNVQRRRPVKALVRDERRGGGFVLSVDVAPVGIVPVELVGRHGGTKVGVSVDGVNVGRARSGVHERIEAGVDQQTDVLGEDTGGGSIYNGGDEKDTNHREQGTNMV